MHTGGNRNVLLNTGPTSGRFLHRSGERRGSSSWNSASAAGKTSASSLYHTGYRQLDLSLGAPQATVPNLLSSVFSQPWKTYKSKVKSTHCCDSRGVCIILVHENYHANGTQQQVLHPTCWSFENSSKWFSIMLEEFVSLSHTWLQQYWCIQKTSHNIHPSQKQPQGWTLNLAVGQISACSSKKLIWIRPSPTNSIINKESTWSLYIKGWECILGLENQVIVIRKEKKSEAKSLHRPWLFP